MGRLLRSLPIQIIPDRQRYTFTPPPLPVAPSGGGFLNLSIVCAAAATLSLTPWAGSYDEVPPPQAQFEDDAKIPTVIGTKSNPVTAFASDDEFIPPPVATVVDEEYDHKAPVIWPQSSVRLSWPDEDVVVKLQSVDNDEWAPKLAPQLKFGSLILWIGSDELPVAPADETEWLPNPTRASWLNPALGLANTPQDEIERISIEDEGWFPPSPRSQWQALVVSDTSGDFVQQQIIPVFEEDSWLSPQIIVSTRTNLLVGGSNPIPPPTNIVDEEYQLQVSKLRVEWVPRIVSDPTDYPIPAVTAIEEEAQPLILIPSPVTSLIVPWDYSVGEDIVQQGIDESEWLNPVKPVVLRYDAQFVNRTDEVIFTILRVEDEFWRPNVLPLVKLIGQRTWSIGLDEIVPAGAVTPIVDEEFSYSTVTTRARLVRYDQWVGEQHESFIPSPPEVCIEGPVSVTITVETPGGSVITLEGPMTITLAGETPSALGVTLEGASPLAVSTEVPTETECND